MFTSKTNSTSASSFGDTVPVDTIKKLRAATGNYTVISPTAYRDPTSQYNSQSHLTEKTSTSKKPAEHSPQSTAAAVGKNGSGWWDTWQRGAEPSKATKEVPSSSSQRTENLLSQHLTFKAFTERANAAKIPVETAPSTKVTSARVSAKMAIEKAPPANAPSAKVPSAKIPTSQPPTIQALTARALAEKELSNTASKDKGRATEYKSPQNEEVINVLSQLQIAEEAPPRTIPVNLNIDMQALAIIQRLTWEHQQKQQKQPLTKPCNSSTVSTLRDSVGTPTKNGESSSKPNVPYPISQTKEPSKMSTGLPGSGLKSIFTHPEDIKMASKQLQIGSLKPEERKKQDEWARKVLKATEKPCPGNYGWVRIDKADKFWPGKSGYRCASGIHMVTDELVAEGMGGYYEGFVYNDGEDKDGHQITRPCPEAPQSKSPIYKKGDPADRAHSEAGREFFGIYTYLVSPEGRGKSSEWWAKLMEMVLPL